MTDKPRRDEGGDREALARLGVEHVDHPGVWPRCRCGWMDYRPGVSPLMTWAEHFADVVRAEGFRRHPEEPEMLRSLISRYRKEADKASKRSASDPNAYLRMTVYERVVRDLQDLQVGVPDD